MTEGRSIVQERELRASPERVFAALHDPERMARWLVPGEMQRATVDVDFRVGGTFRSEEVRAGSTSRSTRPAAWSSPGCRTSFPRPWRGRGCP